MGETKTVSHGNIYRKACRYECINSVDAKTVFASTSKAHQHPIIGVDAPLMQTVARGALNLGNAGLSGASTLSDDVDAPLMQTVRKAHLHQCINGYIDIDAVDAGAPCLPLRKIEHGLVLSQSRAGRPRFADGGAYQIS
jgi:hypothetical protein